MKTRILLAILCLSMCGCESLRTMQQNPLVQFAETQAIKLAASYFSNGGNVDAAWGVSSGISLIGDYLRSNTAAAVTVEQAARDFSGNARAVSGLAQALGNVVVKSGPANNAERQAVVQAIAAGVGKAAGAATGV